MAIIKTQINDIINKDIIETIKSGIQKQQSTEESNCCSCIHSQTSVSHKPCIKCWNFNKYKKININEEK